MTSFRHLPLSLERPARDKITTKLSPEQMHIPSLSSPRDELPLPNANWGTCSQRNGHLLVVQDPNPCTLSSTHPSMSSPVVGGGRTCTQRKASCPSPVSSPCYRHLFYQPCRREKRIQPTVKSYLLIAGRIFTPYSPTIVTSRGG